MQRRNILITPLSWGLGHAGRMIPVAARLIEMGHNVFIAGDEKCLALFEYETRGAKPVFFPGFTMRYSGTLPLALAVILKIPALFWHCVKDHIKIRKLVSKYNIDVIISDNRFGCWNRKVRSVYVTHQLRILLPSPFRFLESAGIALHRLIIEKYDICLVPDFPGDINLSGKLSHNLKLPGNIRYVGLLSRFPVADKGQSFPRLNRQYYSVILSGPEPHRSILRQLLLDLPALAERQIVIFEGKPDNKFNSGTNDKLISLSHLPSAIMYSVISGSEKIICRSGYTTIMELVSIGATALLIPTPGQTEQEYLAEYLDNKGLFTSVPQSECLSAAIKPVSGRKFPAEIIKEGEELLRKALTEISE